MKKLIVKEDLCIGCGACIAIDDKHFEISDEGLSIVKNQENLEDNSILDSIAACPTSAIEITENEEE